MPNGVYTDYGYDNANRLTSLTNKKSDTTTILSSYSYTHDNIGNRLTKSALEGIHNYVYDDIYRLKSADHPALTDEAYTYDNVGNRKTSTEYDNWNHDNNNRLTDNNGYIYAYDDNGNLTTKTEMLTSDQTIYQYDYENRLKRIDYQGGTYSEYEYDPFGNRIKKDDNGVVMYYVYDSEDVIVEYNGSGSVDASYKHGPGIDEPVEMNRNSSAYYYTFDGLGSVVDLTDNNEQVVEQYKYDAFGKIETPPATGNPYTYTSREYDSESGLYFYRARYYDPAAGRFISADPIGFDSGDVNFYGYVKNNPVNFGDPYGLWCQKIGSGTTGSLTIWLNSFYEEFAYSYKVNGGLITSAFMCVYHKFQRGTKEEYISTTYMCCDECGCKIEEKTSTKSKSIERFVGMRQTRAPALCDGAYCVGICNL